MLTANSAAGALGVASFIGLAVAAHRGASSRMRMMLALAACAGLIYVLTQYWFALVLYAVDILLVVGTWRFSRTRGWRVWIGVIVLLLIISKLPTAFAGSDAIPFGLDIAYWLGFSYLAFRLIHVTVDAHAGRIGDATLEETLIYALHPASFVAGPIDRIRASIDSQRAQHSFTDDLHQGLWRILIGAFAKLVIANSLFAFITEHDMAHNPDQPTLVAWLWLIAYSFYLLADFAGYTSIAIGFGRIAGITLPENFDRPYLSPSISVFWQRWHITLSTWLRDYIFFPIARGLRTRVDNRYRALIQFIAHLVTMGTVGLWHGLSGGFLIWGLWHGLGLFIHGQFAVHSSRPAAAQNVTSRLRTGLSILATYLFVTLGWVFFAADLPTALRIFARLFGIN
jgi:alginate O-acetyltransferase complex protein AlgI